ncbi:hemagglutinin repeat-containing protein [Collimonas fungivorans]|uniref:hemagglutinin repeat-containing protein n=1 Tax=Collimonas fungivorans TaxID=158899 RepID=UPI0026ED50DD|nr:hemagglutinin repeat-containing protein [Collimonas fungivorans]
MGSCTTSSSPRATRSTAAARSAAAWGGTSVNLIAGNDIKVTGSGIAGDAAVNLTAKNAITVTAAIDTSKEDHARTVKESGFLSGGGFGISYGTHTTSTDQQQDASLQSGQARSLVGSTAGSLTLNAGGAINVAGSDLMAGQDINLTGTSVTITPGQDQVDGKFVSKMTQDGFTLAVGGSVVNAIQTMQSMSEAASQAQSSRVTAMAAATAALAAKNAAADLAKNGLSINVSLTAGHSESEQTQTTASTSHSGSTLTAGNNIALQADNQVNLLAAQDLESQHSQSKSLSAAAGVAVGYSSKGGLAGGITGSLSASRGTEDGEGATQLNSHVNAGGQLAIVSGGDTSLKGAVASGAQVVADIGGNLNIESLQDTAKFDSKNQSVSVSGRTVTASTSAPVPTRARFPATTPACRSRAESRPATAGSRSRWRATPT